MSIVVVETQSDTPLYPEKPTGSDFRTLDCIAERNGRWCYSLLSSDRHRMICILEAPDAESMRESYRRGGTFFNRMWPGEIFRTEVASSNRDESVLQVLEYNYPEEMTREQWQAEHSPLLEAYVEQDAKLVQSYVSLDHNRIICEINVPDTEIIREIHQRFAIPFEQVWTARVIKDESLS